LDRLKELDQVKAVEFGIAEANEQQTGGQISIAEGWTSYLDYCGRAEVLGGVSVRTHKRYRAGSDKHKKLCRRHGITTWAEFDKKQLERYGNWLNKKYAYRTVYFELTLVKSVVTWLIDNKGLPQECKLRYSLRKPQGTDVHCYSREEVSAMLEHCEQNPKLEWLEHVILALALTGMRIGELAGLRWTDVDLKSGTIRIADERASKRKRNAGTARTTKGKRSRTIPIHPELRKLLLRLDRRRDGLVFHAARGGVLRPDNVRAIFVRSVIEKLKERFPTPEGETGFEHGRLHSFRHFFCSQCFLGGASEGEIKEWLGHADSKMVEHYRHLRNEDAQRKMEQIDFLGTEGGDQESTDVA
jgi:integrase